MKIWAAMLSLLLAGIALADSEIIFFNENPSGGSYYDPSWGYVNAPSTLELINSSKFPVETAHVWAGEHALRLHWRSKVGGDWGLAVASPGWTGWDITAFDTLEMMVNSSAAIPGTNLPSLALEDLNNQKSGRILIGTYFDSTDSSSSTWQRLAIPLEDIPVAACDFTKIKTIFFYQNGADDTERICYLDNIKMRSPGGSNPNLPLPQKFVVRGHDSRIDLRWQGTDSDAIIGWDIYRAASRQGPFERINSALHRFSVYSDFLGENGVSRCYVVRAVGNDYTESLSSDTLCAATAAMDDEALLTSVQEATFRFFYDYAHPVSGLARESSSYDPDLCTSGGSGMGLMTLVVGAERGFEPRDSVATLVLRMMNFLENDAQRYHGAWAHWLNGRTGATVPFSAHDDGGDLVETSFMIQGILTARSYFDADTPVETAIRAVATRLWEGVEWDWYLRYQGGLVLYWHWSPNYGWTMNMQLSGPNETMIAYLLAVASPTHPISAQAYHFGWANNGGYPYVNGDTFFGYPIWVGWDYGGPLFFTHYSFLGFDPRDKHDEYCNYFENNRNISLINRAYCIENPLHHTGYSDLVWGLTASNDPWGYQVHEPNYSSADNGTITPTAALSAMAYIPEESLASLRHFYHTLGPRLWKSFGFTDAFHLGVEWFSSAYLAIDQGTIVPMIENHRTGLCWELFMANPEIQPMLEALGFENETRTQPVRPQHFELLGIYPNPANHQARIEFILPVSGPVTLELFNALGQKVPGNSRTITLPAGRHAFTLEGERLSSGMYVVRLSNGHQTHLQKAVILK